MKAVYFPPASCKHSVPDLTLDLQAISLWREITQYLGTMRSEMSLLQMT